MKCNDICASITKICTDRLNLHKMTDTLRMLLSIVIYLAENRACKNDNDIK